MTTRKDLLSIGDIGQDELGRILDSAASMKRRGASTILAGKTMAMIFEKPSLRTKVSFDVAMHQLGGHTIYLSGEEVGLGKREPASDIAQVLSRYVNFIVARTYAHRTIESLARQATVPVINALSEREHPCQAIADLLTIRERKGRLQHLTVAYIGDGNNVAASLFLACMLAGAGFRLAAPEGYELPEDVVRLGQRIAAGQPEIAIGQSPTAAVKDADVVYTDVWTSMGQESEIDKRRVDFASYQITAELLSRARPDAILMHPMPVHWGEELSPDLARSPQSALLDQAENRLHAQKAILAELATRAWPIPGHYHNLTA